MLSIGNTSSKIHGGFSSHFHVRFVWGDNLYPLFVAPVACCQALGAEIVGEVSGPGVVQAPFVGASRKPMNRVSWVSWGGGRENCTTILEGNDRFCGRKKKNSRMWQDGKF